MWMQLWNEEGYPVEEEAERTTFYIFAKDYVSGSK